MRLVTFATDGEARLGALLGAHVLDLPAAYAAWARTSAAGQPSLAPAAFPTTLLGFLQAGEPARDAAAQALAFAGESETLAAFTRLGLARAADAVTYLPPVTQPGKIICLGQNYRQHAREMGGPPPEYPMLFAKYNNTLIGHRQAIVLPRVSSKVDYEAELVVVIGRTGKDIPAERALDYIAGYSIFNDVSVRDYQHRTAQFLQGKTFDTSGPFGPAVVTLGEIADPNALPVTLRLNGTIMQESNTSDLIFDVPTLIAYISQIMTLDPGDLIVTGTPGGVGVARDPQVFLAPGDVVQIEIGGVGTLENSVQAPR